MTRGLSRLIWAFAIFLSAALATRIGLAFLTNDHFTRQEWIDFLLVGAMFDLVIATCFALPWALYDIVVPAQIRWPIARKIEAVWSGAWALAYVYLVILIGVMEFVFWSEFASRFNFVAVDYLIYTHEVIGNIRESYPVGTWFALIFVGAVVIWWATWPRRWARYGARWPMRVATCAILGAVCAASLLLARFDMSEGDANVEVRELSMNGVYAFFYAFSNNQIDYARFYPTLPQADALALARGMLTQKGSSFRHDDGIERFVPANDTVRKLNVVLISVESLSASYLGVFGNPQGLTPELDALSQKGLLFTNLYATGTRTVRGLEALSVGAPPIPGNSIVRRPNNDNLETLGEELDENGWAAHWIYGGYGLFDNMNAYFAGNSYEVTDRRDIDPDKIPIHHETIWGVADEDLYTLSMTKFDEDYAKKKPFFAHIMTTSNHRPFTFPEGRVDRPQKTHEGGVQYTDWAIGDFIRRASSKPWFANTLFVIVADHTASAAGKTDLPVERYHIPMIWYAPGHIQPGRMDRLMSQIDIPTTILGWLGIAHESKFFGYDMFKLEPGRERAFISNYQTLGYMKNNRLVVLRLRQDPVVVDGTPAHPVDPIDIDDKTLIREAIANYQVANQMFRDGELREDDEDENKDRDENGRSMDAEQPMAP